MFGLFGLLPVCLIWNAILTKLEVSLVNLLDHGNLEYSSTLDLEDPFAGY